MSKLELCEDGRCKRVRLGEERHSKHVNDAHLENSDRDAPFRNRKFVMAIFYSFIIIAGIFTFLTTTVTYSPSIDANSEPTIPLNRVELSNLPLLNEVVTITIDARNPSLNSSLEHVVKFYLKDGWEFVNVPKSSIENFVYSDNSTIRIVTENFTVNEGKIQTFSKQIKPTLLGINYFAVGIPYGSSAQFSLVIGENRTIPTDQYWEENPDLAPWNNEPEPEPCINEWCEPEPRPMEEYTGTPDEDTTEYTDDAHFNETRKKQGLPPINNTSYSDYVSPKKQLESGVLPEDIQCRENKVLVIRDNGNPACVKEETAQKTGWDIIATEFAQKIVPSNQEVQINDKVENNLIEHESTVDNETNNNDEQEFIVLDLGSDVEYVDDGREIYRATLQKSPAPQNIYERIIDNQEDSNIDPHGNMRIPAGFAHEKYSIVDGIGLYPADWMPTYIPDGYQLLYFDNYHFTEGTGRAELRIYFVPNTFELTNQTTTRDIDISHGFVINAYRETAPLNEIEDTMEYVKEILESQSGYEGRWLNIQRDGKTVWASETQNNINHYDAVVAFHPDEYTSVGIISYYHTLEELKPIFDSVMN